VKEAATLIQDGEARSLKEGTIALYRQTLLQELVPWCETEKIREDVRKLNTEKLREYRVTWKCAPTTASLRIYRLRTFFGLCVDAGRVDSIPRRSSSGRRTRKEGIRPPSPKASSWRSTTRATNS